MKMLPASEVDFPSVVWTSLDVMLCKDMSCTCILMSEKIMHFRIKSSFYYYLSWRLCPILSKKIHHLPTMFFRIHMFNHHFWFWKVLPTGYTRKFHASMCHHIYCQVKRLFHVFFEGQWIVWFERTQAAIIFCFNKCTIWHLKKMIHFSIKMFSYSVIIFQELIKVEFYFESQILSVKEIFSFNTLPWNNNHPKTNV